METPIRNSRWRLRIQNAIFVLFLVAAIGLLAFLSERHHFQVDWTVGQRNTLSQGSQDLLGRLNGPISITAFVPYDSARYDAIKRQIERYQRYKKDITLEFVNPELAPDRAKAAGVTRPGQLQVIYSGRKEMLDELSEQSLTNALARLTRDKPRLALFVEGHGERDYADTSDKGYSQLADVLMRSGFTIDHQNFVRSPVVPENADLLVMASPQKKLVEGEVVQLNAWLERGGNLLWLDDPGETVGLEPLAKTLGLDFVPGVIVDANEELHLLLGIKHPAVVPVVDYGRHPITQNLQTQTLFPFAEGMERVKDAGGDWQYQTLLSTLSRTWSEVGSLSAQIKYNEEAGDKLGPFKIGFALNREHAGHSQRVVVIGDSDFMANGSLGLGANLDLAVNAFNWLAKDDALVSISQKRAPDLQLNLSAGAALFLSIGFLIVLPAGLLVAGFVIWFRRRRR